MNWSRGQVYWGMPLISVPGNRRQVDLYGLQSEFEVIQAYIVRPCLKKKVTVTENALVVFHIKNHNNNYKLYN